MDIAYKENTEIEDRTIDSHVKRIRKNSRKLTISFQLLKLGTVVDIDGMLVNEKKKVILNIKKILIV